VTDVIFTHGHPDHLWGLIDDFDEIVFPNASFHMGRAEWDFWRDPGTVDAMPEERKTFAVGAQNRLAVLADMINLFEPGAEVVPGVEAVDTSGHTPGHMSFMLHGGTIRC
jgi:glyoxylase-like metal-dependent hydrolase (beta-lactamase superfamily II)